MASLDPAREPAPPTPPRGWWLRAGKRAFDALAAVAGLSVLAPVLLLIAAWIKLDSRGPVFFRQERVGRYGRVFRIHKFRTMHSVAVPLAVPEELTIGADPRITVAGRWLRRTKLDELPQLIDVLVGNMSLVGPRPEVPRYVAHWPAHLRQQVLMLRPGITDLASIEFRDESALLAQAPDPQRYYIEVIAPRKLQLAVRYLQQASLRTDLKLIARTLLAIMAR